MTTGVAMGRGGDGVDTPTPLLPEAVLRLMEGESRLELD